MSILKKFALLLTICAAVGFNDSNVAFAYPDPVAVIKNYSKVKNEITITRANGPATGSQALLYPDDKITGNVGKIIIVRGDKIKDNVGKIIIECGDYVDFRNIDNQYYLISHNPPSGWLENLREHMKVFFRKAYNILVEGGEPVDDYLIALTRGPEDSNLSASYGIDLNPRPGFNATLLKDQKVCFAGVITATQDGRKIAPKSFAIKDSNGQKISGGVFNKNGEAEIDLSTQNFKVGEKYTWIVDGSKKYQFSILDDESTQMIQDKYFSKIDAKKMSPEERNFEKAFWAQKISEDSNGKIDLYWLSAQLLVEISPKSKDAQQEKLMLLQKYHKHLVEEFNR